MGAQLQTANSRNGKALNPYVQLGVCVGGIYVSFLVWAIVSTVSQAFDATCKADPWGSTLQCQERRKFSEISNSRDSLPFFLG